MKTDALPKRFWDKVRKDAKTGCWKWIAASTGNGYGQFTWENRQQGAHRVAYSSLVGKIPEGLELDHLCRTRLCVNPSHLEAVTRKVNHSRSDITQSALLAKRTQCSNGHEYKEGSFRIRIDNRQGKRSRVCISCERMYSARRK